MAVVASTPTSAVSRRVSISSSRSSSIAFLPRNRLAIPSPRLALVFDMPCLRRAKKLGRTASVGAAGVGGATGVGSGTGSGAGVTTGAAGASGASPIFRRKRDGAGATATGADTGSGAGSVSTARGSTCGAGGSSTGASTGAAGGTTAASSALAGGSGSAGRAASSGAFLRIQPNRPFFSSGAAGAFLSSLEPNMRTVISGGAARRGKRFHDLAS
ncbi:hypothetical protein D9M69_353830 [compost metagenome]